MSQLWYFVFPQKVHSIRIRISCHVDVDVSFLVYSWFALLTVSQLVSIVSIYRIYSNCIFDCNPQAFFPLKNLSERFSCWIPLSTIFQGGRVGKIPPSSRKKMLKVSFSRSRFLCFCQIHRFQNPWRIQRHCYIMEVILKHFLQLSYTFLLNPNYYQN